MAQTLKKGTIIKKISPNFRKEVDVGTVTRALTSPSSCILPDATILSTGLKTDKRMEGLMLCESLLEDAPKHSYNNVPCYIDHAAAYTEANDAEKELYKKIKKQLKSNKNE